MGRRADADRLTNRLRAVRLERGMAQAELARCAGLTRQAISAIEAGSYIPNTVVALRLAAALSCLVDDLFGLETGGPAVEAEWAGPAPWPGGPQPVSPLPLPDPAGAQPAVPLLPPGLAQPAAPLAQPPPFPARVAIARIGRRLLARSLDGPTAIVCGLAPADGVALAVVQPGLQQLEGGHRPTDRVTVQLAVDQERLERTAVVSGCDPALAILAAHVARRAPQARVLWFDSPSRAALDALARGETHVAGTHLLQAGDFNVAEARAALGARGGLVVTFAHWEQGLMVPIGNPKGLRRLDDLARPDVAIVNRQPGAGSRELLDRGLAALGIPAAAIGGYDRIAHGHLAAAEAVAAGAADAAIGVRAAAATCRLDFVPLAAERFDLVIPTEYLEHPTVQTLLDILQSRSLRAELRSLPGYQVDALGSVVARV